MNQKDGRIERMFQKLKAEGKKAFIPFLTAGYPDLETSYQAVEAMVANGASLVELGVPYSDPSADGPAIMMADEYALNRGVRLKDVFDLASRIRGVHEEFPVVLLLYFNCIFCYGPDRFFRTCQQSGIDGVIIPDLPYEEMDEIRADAQRYDIRLISLVTPVSKGRMEKIARSAEGFLYCVSSLGVTGERAQFATDFGSFFDKLNQYTETPRRWVSASLRQNRCGSSNTSATA